MADKKHSSMLDSLSFVPRDKTVCIMEDGELVFGANPDTIIETFNRFDDLEKYVLGINNG